MSIAVCENPTVDAPILEIDNQRLICNNIITEVEMSDFNFVKDDPKLIEYVKQAVSSFFDVKIDNVKYLGGGSFGMVYMLSFNKPPYKVAFKISKAEDMHRKEEAELRLLKSVSPIKFPEVYFAHDKTPDLPIDAICMEFIEGNNLLFSINCLYKSKKKRKAFAKELTSCMHEIHSHTSEKFGPIENPTFNTWQEYYRPFAENIFKESKKYYEGGVIPKKVFSIMEYAFARYDKIFCEEVNVASVIHGDLNVMNVMVNPKTLDITAIIDPLNAMYADFEYDLFQLNNMTGKRYYLYKTYKENYLTSKLVDLKCAFYAMWNEAYCFLKSGTYLPLFMNPIAKNLKKQLRRFDNVI